MADGYRGYEIRSSPITGKTSVYWGATLISSQFTSRADAEQTIDEWLDAP